MYPCPECINLICLILMIWARFLKGGINYTRYNSYSRDKSAILGITTQTLFGLVTQSKEASRPGERPKRERWRVIGWGKESP